MGEQHLSKIHEFAREDAPNLSREVAAILAAPSELSDDEINALYAVLKERLPREDHYGAQFSFTSEIDELIGAARAMRMAVMEGNRVREGVTVRELRETITASNTLLQTLLKMHEKILNYDRQRAMEVAVLAAIDDLDASRRELFFTALSGELEKIT